MGNCPIKPETMQNKLDDDLNVSELITIRCMDDTMVCECLITIASPQIYSRHPVKVKVITVCRNGQPPLGVAASRP